MSSFLVRTALFLFVAAFPLGTVAQEAELARGILCDTKEEAIEFASALSEASPIEALAKVNLAHNDNTACAFGFVMFERKQSVASVQTPTGGADVVEITVVGAFTSGGWIKLDEPQTQYVLFEKKGQDI